MSAVATVHATAEEIERFASELRSNSPEFDSARRHLAEGCPECRQTLVACLRKRLPAKNADGWLVPNRVERPADRRAGVLADHQLVCGAGDYELDVIVREIDAPQRLDIGGQVTQAASLHDPARNVPLRLLEAKDCVVVSSTETDDFGEFDFSAKPGLRYGLLVGEAREAPCILVWDGTL